MTLTHHHQLPVFFCTSNFQTPCIGCPKTRSPEKRGEICIKGQINNPKEKLFNLEQYQEKNILIRPIKAF
jgi:hypothetical protein